MILYVDTKILKNNVNPSIKESKKKLNSAKGIVSKIKVPEGFASTNKLKKSIPKRITDVDTDMGDLYKFVSKKIDLFTNAGKNIISMGKTNILKFGVKITASSVNECLSLVKGLGNFAESLLDTGATIAAVGVTPIAGLSDLINYLTGNEVSAVDELWRGTKGLIANEVVNSAFKDLYENYEFGKWLDENAFKPYKSTGAIPRLTEGIGELAGTALLTLFTAGAGAAANPATASKLFTLLRGLTGAGKALQDFWKESSGDIEGTDNLVDTLKGLGYATYIGAWEALQAYIGGDTLKGIQVLKNQFLNSLVRIGIDTGFNMADTPYRSLMDVIFKGKEWNEAWKDQGGWTSLLINGGIGFIGSTFGEALDYKNELRDNELKLELNAKANDAVQKYIENIADYQGKGISFEEYLSNNGINILQISDKKSAALYLGDSKLFLFESAEETLKNGNLSYEESEQLTNILKKYYSTHVSQIDNKKLIKELSPYLSKSEISTAKKLYSTGMAEQFARECSKEQKAAIHNYTNCGGFEINAFLNDGKIGGGNGPRARDVYSSIDELQDIISGRWIGPEKYNLRFDSSEGSIVNALDSAIDSAKYDDVIIGYRACKHLYDNSSRIDVGSLKPGDIISSSDGYQSASAVYESSFAKHINEGYDIIIKEYISPNSGSAAYIENITGVKNYGQMEILGGRGKKMKLIDYPYLKRDVFGVIRTIVPVWIQ